MDRAQRLADGSPPGVAADRAARLHAAFDAAGPVRLYAEAPWRLFGPILAPDRQPSYYLTNTTAGILSGDCLSADFCLGAGARLRLAAPAASRVHTMRPGGRAAQRFRFTLAEGAALTYWPNQLIPFAGADFTQETTFRLAPGAGLVAADLLAPGRLAAGESFAYAAVRTRTRIFLGDRLVLADQAAFEPGRRRPEQAGILEGYTHLGSLYLAGEAAVGTDLEALAALLEEREGLLAAVSRPHPQVVVARVLGHGAEAVAALLGLLSPGLL